LGGEARAGSSENKGSTTSTSSVWFAATCTLSSRSGIGGDRASLNVTDICTGVFFAHGWGGSSVPRAIESGVRSVTCGLGGEAGAGGSQSKGFAGSTSSIGFASAGSLDRGSGICGNRAGLKVGDTRAGVVFAHCRGSSSIPSAIESGISSITSGLGGEAGAGGSQRNCFAAITSTICFAGTSPFRGVSNFTSCASSSTSYASAGFILAYSWRRCCIP